jgi:aspirochlorine biosynthesis cytochrome P450 monooxygenase
MICPELCRDRKFLGESTSMLQSIFMTAIIVVTLPLGPFRERLAWLITLPHKWKLDRCVATLRPIVEQRIEQRQSTHKQDTKLESEDAISWTLDLVTGDPIYDTRDKLTHEIPHNLWAASSAPGGMMTEIVYQLLA